MDLLLLATSNFCKNLNFTNFGSVGQCFVETTLFGDVTLAGLIIFILFTALIVRYNFPIQTILPVGLGLAYVLWLMTGATLFMGILILGLIVGGAILVIGMLQYLNR
jgi:hypothetical protein